MMSGVGMGAVEGHEVLEGWRLDPYLLRAGRLPGGRWGGPGRRR